MSGECRAAGHRLDRRRDIVRELPQLLDGLVSRAAIQEKVALSEPKIDNRLAVPG